MNFMRSVELHRGASRLVLLLGPWAIKFGWRRYSHAEFMTGPESNRFEFSQWRKFRDRTDELCPNIWADRFGLVLVMRRIDRELTDVEFAELVFDRWIDRYSPACPDAHPKVEMKPSSFGWLEGRIIAIDYGEKDA